MQLMRTTDTREKGLPGADAGSPGRKNASGSSVSPRRGRSLRPTWALVLLDAGLINLGFFLAWFARYQLQLGAEIVDANWLPWTAYVSIQAILTGVLIIVFKLKGLYDTQHRRSWADEVSVIASGTLIGSAVMVVGVFYARSFGYSRLVFIFAGVIIVVLLALARSVEYWIRNVRRRSGIGLIKILVVGNGPLGRAIVQNVVALPDLGYQVVGLADDDNDQDLGRYEWLGRTEDVPKLVAEHDVDEVVIALPSESHTKVAKILLSCAEQQVSFRIAPDFYQLSLNQLDIVELNGIPLIGVRELSLSGPNLFIKRVIDVVVSGTLLVLSAPVSLVVALAIYLEDPGPILVTQTRVGRHGKPFPFYKFRSMCVNADNLLADLQTKNEASGPVFKIRSDPRRTRVGRIIRKLSIDELPQFYNILRGDMSLVGPRPPFPWEVEKYEDWHHKRLEVTPGLTGLGQVSGRSDLPFDETALLDLWYIENWSLGLDLKILLRTVPAVLSGRGAY
jgi:exopolysaccharide biosynthesis polyprenyl glycosylphosphotransferase